MYPKQVIYGQCPSKSNCYRIITIRGHGSLGKTTAMKQYEESFLMQCSLRKAMISKRFKLTVDVYYKSDQPDLDNSLKVILDCLQTCKAIKNDRLCAEIHARKLIDKLNPRVEFEIEELV
jgi:Holliday junction resolvase RusA-like endonuclease